MPSPNNNNQKKLPNFLSFAVSSFIPMYLLQRHYIFAQPYTAYLPPAGLIS